MGSEMDDKGGGVGFEGGSGFKRASTDSNKTLVSSDDERGLIDGDLVIDKGKKSKAKSKPPVSFNPSSSPLSEKRSNHHHHPHHQKTIYILKTPLGHLIGFLFGPETLTIFLSGWLLTNLRDWYFRVDHVVDYLATIPDPFGRYPYVYVFLLQFLVQGAVSTAWAWPTRVRKLPLLVYGGVMLHQEMRRETTGKTHRRVLAGTKAMVAGYAALAVWMTGRMPARHESGLLEDVRFTHEPGQPGWTVALGFYLLFYDILGIVWGILATIILGYVVLMNVLLCFAWSAGSADGEEYGKGYDVVKDKIQLERKMEEGRCRRGSEEEGGGVEGRSRYCLRRVRNRLRLRERAARMGERMLGFATRQY